jgi:iron complex outermembrane receptor protein/outer membrane receptor for ferrienterochelin and colicins
MEPATAELDEVVIVSSSRTNSRIEDLPTKMEVLGSEEVHEENGIKPGNIASLLGDIAGIQIQQTNAATGNADMRIQGLQGKYTQILRDGMPLFGGYAGSFSILQIPPLDLQQVELVKGASSTLYGGGAIAGMLNLISKKPKLNKFESSLTLNVSDANEKNINIFSAARNNKFGYTFFAGNTTQQAKDANGDGFSDFPDLKSVFVHPRLFIYGKEESTLMLGYTLTSEDRKGGDMQLLKNSIQHEQAFFIQNKILRNTFDANWEKGVGVDGQIVFKSNYSLFNRDITTNIFGLKGQQDSWYNELAYTTKTDKHHVVMGINFNGEDFKKKGLDSSLISNTAASTFGIFGQDDWRFANQWTLQSGIRLDRNNMYGNFLLPRFSLMYKINAQYTMRLGGGLGYKTPSLFNAEMDERDYKYYTGFKKGTESERSTGINYDINFKKKLNGWDLTINQTFFYNNISHPIVLATNKNQFTYFNESKNLESIGFESFIQVIKNPMEFYAGYVYTDAKRNYNSSNPNLPLVAKHKIATVIAFKIDEAFRVGIESSYTGSQNLDNGNKTNPYWIAAIMTKYTIGKCSFVLNCENLFDIKQSNFATIVSGPNSNPIFTELWAPVYGRTLNLSMYAKF